MGLWEFFKNLVKCKECELRDAHIIRLQQLHDIQRADFLDQIHYLREHQTSLPVQPMNSEEEGESDLKPIRGHKSARLILAELSRKPGNNLQEKQEQFEKEASNASGQS